MFEKLFGKKEINRFTDKTYISLEAKFAAIIELCKQNNDAVFICWFTDTLNDLKKILNENQLEENKVKHFRNFHFAGNQQVYFAEHYPLRNKENELIANWDQPAFTVYNSLDEPLFQAFGSGEMVHMATAMGLKPDEAIEHKLVSSAIRKAQDKLATSLTTELHADTAKRWMELNFKKYD